MHESPKPDGILGRAAHLKVATASQTKTPRLFIRAQAAAASGNRKLQIGGSAQGALIGADAKRFLRRALVGLGESRLRTIW